MSDSDSSGSSTDIIGQLGQLLGIDITGADDNDNDNDGDFLESLAGEIAKDKIKKVYNRILSISDKPSIKK